MSEMTARQAISELENLRDCVDNNLYEIKEILKQFPRVQERANSYWLAHIKTALRKETEYLGGSFVTMDDTIRELEEEILEEA